MLKLTHSFCRYSSLTLENVSSNTSYVKTLKKLSCNREICGARVPHVLKRPYTHLGLQSRLLAHIKKWLRIKRPYVNLGATKATSQMSESYQPPFDHISYGGQFEVSNLENEEWGIKLEAPSAQAASEKRSPIQVPPNFRVWESVGKKKETYDNNPFRFRVLSYNVLAQYLLECHPYLYTDCVPRNLKWKVRAGRLLQEITSLSPDIICLQEVQASHINNFYSKFEQMGYCGLFKQKTGHRLDGCAIYFKQALFKMQEHISVEFYQPELPILNRDNIGIMVKLLPVNSPDTPIVVATTHLLYNPKRTDVRLAQIQVLLAEIDRFAYHDDGKKSGYLPIILTGDFNSTPDSAVINLLDKGFVSATPFRDNSDWKRIGVTDNCQHLSVHLNRQKGADTDFSMIKIYNSDYSETAPDPELYNEDPSQCNYSAMFNSGTLDHSLNLASVYHNVKPDGHQEATTFQDYWITVDYIYFSSCSSLKLVERLRLPTADECEVLGSLPNDVYGSDHLSLAATFEIKPVKSSL